MSTASPEEMNTQAPDAKNEVERIENVDHDSKSFPLCEQSHLSPEERKKERRFLLKIDTTILPLLGIIYFLASMVSILCGSFNMIILLIIDYAGSWRYQ